jgi:hypothetical protein
MESPQTFEECAEKLQAALQGLMDAREALDNDDPEGAKDIISRTIGVLG